MEKSDDALKALVSGLGDERLGPADRAAIMARVRAEAERRRVRYDGRFELFMGAAFAVVFAAAAVFAFASGRVGLPYIGPYAARSLQSVGTTLADIRLPHISPVAALVAVCGAALLIIDMFLRKWYFKKHF